MKLLQALLPMALLLVLLAPAAHAQQAETFSSDTVWDWYNHAEDLPPLCGASTWYELDPSERVADAGCVQVAMRQLGASASAVRLFELTRQFLYSFDERGAIDFGVVSSPWLNMGRGEGVLLNGAPSAILMSDLFAGDDKAWRALPGYAEVLSRAPMAFPWVEYGGPQVERALADGGSVVGVNLDMRECRACPNVATFRADVRFAPDGYIAGIDVLPPAPARR